VHSLAYFLRYLRFSGRQQFGIAHSRMASLVERWAEREEHDRMLLLRDARVHVRKVVDDDMKRLKPEVPVDRIVTSLCCAQRLVEAVQLHSVSLTALLCHAMASATVDAHARATREPPVKCCAICLVLHQQLHREPVLPHIFTDHADPSLGLGRYAVFVCGCCELWLRELEVAFFQEYAACFPNSVPVQQFIEQQSRPNGDSSDGDSDSDSDSDDKPRDPREDVRKYILVTYLKALMCPPTHPPLGANIVGPAMLPWVSALHAVRKELGFQPNAVGTAQVWVATLPSADHRHFSVHKSGPTSTAESRAGSTSSTPATPAAPATRVCGVCGRDPDPQTLPVWGCVRASAAVFVPLGAVLALFVPCAPELPPHTSAGEWGICKGDTELRHVLPINRWPVDQLEKWLAGNTIPPGATHASDLSEPAQATGPAPAGQATSPAPLFAAQATGPAHVLPDEAVHGALDEAAHGALDEAAHGALDEAAHGALDETAHGAPDETAHGALEAVLEESGACVAPHNGTRAAFSADQREKKPHQVETQNAPPPCPMARRMLLRGHEALVIDAESDTSVSARVGGVMHARNMDVAGDLVVRDELHAHDPIRHLCRVQAAEHIVTVAQVGTLFVVPRKCLVRLPDAPPQGVPLVYQVVGNDVDSLEIHGNLAPTSVVSVDGTLTFCWERALRHGAHKDLEGQERHEDQEGQEVQDAATCVFTNARSIQLEICSCILPGRAADGGAVYAFRVTGTVQSHTAP